MKTAGGEAVEILLTGDRLFGRLQVTDKKQPAIAFLTAEQLRELARECEHAAAEIERAALRTEATQ
jgi:hypothetical protein